MKRRFALPAAIALTAHALLFMGVGKPPVPPPVALMPVTPPDEDPWKIQLKPEPPVATEEGSDKPNGPSVEAPPGVPELPPTEIVKGVRIEQEYIPFEPGNATKITALNMGPLTGDKNGRKPLTIDLLDDKPRTRFQKPPIYPGAMKTAGNSGTVWVEFVVDETGRVHDVRVLKSTHPGFEDATVTAVSEWRFESGKRKGIPVRFRMSIPVVFNLSE